MISAEMVREWRSPENACIESAPRRAARKIAVVFIAAAAAALLCSQILGDYSGRSSTSSLVLPSASALLEDIMPSSMLQHAQVPNTTFDPASYAHTLLKDVKTRKQEERKLEQDFAKLMSHLDLQEAQTGRGIVRTSRSSSSSSSGENSSSSGEIDRTKRGVEVYKWLHSNRAATGAPARLDTIQSNGGGRGGVSRGEGRVKKKAIKMIQNTTDGLKKRQVAMLEQKQRSEIASVDK